VNAIGLDCGRCGMPRPDGDPHLRDICIRELKRALERSLDDTAHVTACRDADCALCRQIERGIAARAAAR
jgi:hypothetical protein